MHTQSGRAIYNPSNGKTPAKLPQHEAEDSPGSDAQDDESALFSSTEISQASAERARLLDPNEGRCIITGHVDDVRPCCILSRNTSDAKVCGRSSLLRHGTEVNAVV
jgi:hypothetical protein